MGGWDRLCDETERYLWLILLVVYLLFFHGDRKKNIESKEYRQIDSTQLTEDFKLLNSKKNDKIQRGL